MRGYLVGVILLGILVCGLSFSLGCYLVLVACYFFFWLIVVGCMFCVVFLYGFVTNLVWVLIASGVLFAYLG